MVENKKMGLTNAKKRDTSYKPKPKVSNSFESGNNELLNNVGKINKVEELSKNNKSIVIPSNVWCDFYAILYASDNDYSYELLEEMLSNYKEQHNFFNNSSYIKKLERLEEDELEKLERKKKKAK